METITLYRPVGPKELALIQASAEELAEFNQNIIGLIEVIAEFPDTSNLGA